MVVITALVVLWAWWVERPLPKPSTPLDDVPESDVRDAIVADFVGLFPNWELVGKEYPTGAGRRAGKIDILAKDPDGHYVVVELKKKKAVDRVVPQVTRYMSYVQATLADDDTVVKGLIIAPAIDPKLTNALRDKDHISARTFRWVLELSPPDPGHNGAEGE